MTATTTIPSQAIEINYDPDRANQMHTVLMLEDYELRYNIRAERLEYRHDKGVWKPLEDRDISYIRNRVFSKYVTPKTATGDNKPYNVSKENFQDYAEAITYDIEVDPFLDYLEGLPDIEPGSNPLCDRLFHDIFAQKIESPPFDSEITLDDEDEFHRYTSRLIPLSAVHRAYKPGCKYDLAVAVSGAQQAGKDTLFEQILPQIPHQDLYTASFSFEMSGKEMNEATAGAVFVCASEMAGITRSDKIENIKRWMTEKADKGRRAYRRNAEVRPRDYCIVCTTNFEKPLPNDPTGNRRFLVVTLTEERAVCALEDWFEVIVDPADDPRLPEPMTRRDIIWAEAKALYHDADSDRVILPENIMRIQKIKNANLAHTDTQLEDAWNAAVKHGCNLDTNPHTSRSIATMLGIVDNPADYPKVARSFQYRIDALLEPRGYVQTKNRVTLKYMHDDANPDLFSGREKVWVPKGHPLLKGPTPDTFYSRIHVEGQAYQKYHDGQ